MSRVHIDHKETHDWIVPRRVMCGFFWIGIILLFTGIILLVTSRHKESPIYSSWGYVLLGLGFTLLLICLILCLHAYCIITVSEEEPFEKKKNSVPSTPVMRHKMANGGLILENRKENEKGVNREPQPLLSSPQRNGRLVGDKGTPTKHVRIYIEDDSGSKIHAYGIDGPPTPSPQHTPNNTPKGSPYSHKRANGNCVTGYYHLNGGQYPVVIKKVTNETLPEHSRSKPVVYSTSRFVGGNYEDDSNAMPSSPKSRSHSNSSKSKLPDAGELSRISSLKSGEEGRPRVSLSVSAHEHDLRRFSNPTVAMLDRDDLEASKLSIYDNVHYVVSEK